MRPEEERRLRDAYGNMYDNLSNTDPYNNQLFMNKDLYVDLL